MPKFRVLLHGTQAALQDVDAGQAQLGGFYVVCAVEAANKALAGELALAQLRQHPKYLALAAWPLGSSRELPPVAVDSVDRFPWWRRFVPGIATGFIFYVDTDKQPAPM